MRRPLAMTLVLACSMLAASNAAEPEPGAADRPSLEVATAYASLASLKIKVAQAYANAGRFPPTYLEANLDGPVKAPYFIVELGTEGMLEITFTESADPVLAGKEVKAIPAINESGDIIWYCLAPDIPRHVRPRSCL